jgi:hypothetical protein
MPVISIRLPVSMIAQIVLSHFPPILKGQSHEKVGEMSVWGISLGPN